MSPVQQVQERPPCPSPHETNESNLDNQTPCDTQDVLSSIEDIAITQKFIYDLRKATLSNDILPEKMRYLLRNPIEAEPDLEDPDLRLSIKLYMGAGGESEWVYNDTRSSILERHPNDPILSFHKVKQKIEELTGITSIVHDMCINSCLAYTGPFSELLTCPYCGEPRYEAPSSGSHRHKNVHLPRQQFHTIPIGPQIQAQWRSPAGAREAKYRSYRTEELLSSMHPESGDLKIDIYDDFLHGFDYLQAVANGDITSDDTVLLFSFDGAQLYKNKQSDCWIAIWVLLDLHPDARYKKVKICPAFFIPGPNNPQNAESFQHPSLHHVSALQKEGFRIWDADTKRVFTSRPITLLFTADGVALVDLNGLVGHKGARGCRAYCDLNGRRKPNDHKYYPALLLPDNYDVQGCNHPDVDVSQYLKPSAEKYARNLAYLLSATSATNYKDRRRDTGISRPSIISGLVPSCTLGIPGSFPLDLMHLASLNIPDILIGLWRGTLACDFRDDKATWDWATLTGKTWETHGKRVAGARQYLPGSFDRPPRNIAEKLNSGYKAWEFLIYLYGLGPGLLCRLLPSSYWQHFCQLVSAIRRLHQKKIAATSLRQVHSDIVSFLLDFERLYCQRKAERLHFVHPCIHLLVHAVVEVERMGPLPYHSQWTMEQTIGDLGREVKQPSNPYANLSSRGLRRSQLNALRVRLHLYCE